jgi:hypothetical protein
MSRLPGVLAVIWLGVSAVAVADDYSGEAYTSCAACHLPDGAGVPGAFPPIKDRAAKIAALEGGRDYLITVVTYGLMGTIQVDGVQYFGVMAGNSGTLDAAAVAAALNYVVFELADGEAAGIEPFTAAEVEAVQAGVALKSPAGGGQLRESLVNQHGDQWP